MSYDFVDPMGTNNTLFIFIADKEDDLSSGILYAAIWEQTSDFGGGSAVNPAHEQCL